MTAVYEKFHSKVDFLAVYISEAHAADEWKLYTDVCFDQPKTIDERFEICSKFASRLHCNMELVVDTMSNEAQGAFSSWPERLYCVGPDKKIAYKGALGPDGYLPEEVDTWLSKNVTL